MEKLTREMWMKMHWEEKGFQYMLLYVLGKSSEEDKLALENIQPGVKGHWGEGLKVYD